MTGIDHYASATEILAALDAGAVEPVEVTELFIARIEARNPELNAVVVPTFERARLAARKAALRGRGVLGRMLGLPITLKESTQVAGLPASAGIRAQAEYAPEQDGRVAAALFAEGVALLGKTNIPVALGDWQSDSPVYGRTNNPWDLARTPGGSTGGGGAALAAGMTPFEIGSDIGGSIRVPAAYCGVYGHRPSETAVPKSGGFPGRELPNPAGIMSVQGPLARSVDDLELGMDVIAGPDIGEERGWRLDFPEPRAERLGDFRVAVLPESGLGRASAEMRERVEDLAGFLEERGTRVEVAGPAIDEQAYFLDYVRLLNMQNTVGRSREQREARASALRAMGGERALAQAEGMTMDAAEFHALLERRERARRTWEAFFMDWDVVIAPMALDAAFPHQTAAFDDRRLDIDGEEVDYFLNILYPMWAIYAGLPSTAFPGGLNSAGLPLGLQAIGPYLEDRTTLRFAGLLEREWRGFEAPPRF